MNLTTILLFYVGVCAALMYILMMGPTRFHRNGIVGKLNDWLHKAPGLIGFVICVGCSCGNVKKANERWGRVEERLMRKKNPAVMMFYIVVVGGAVALYATEVVTQIADPFSRFFSTTVIGLSALSFIVCVRSDPGIVTPSKEACEKSPSLRKYLDPKQRLLSEADEKKQNKKFKFDGVLYNPGPNGNGTKCSTCGTERPARSKHCSLCGYCVRRYDHHCPWINNDVAENNHRYFILFLYIHMVLCFVAAFDSFCVLADYVDTARLWSSQFMSKSGQAQPASWRIVIMYCLFKMPWVVAVGAFGFIVGLVLVGFLIFQLKSVVRGLTSNEVNKIEDVVDFVENAVEFEEYLGKWQTAIEVEAKHRQELVDKKRAQAEKDGVEFDEDKDEDANWVAPQGPTLETHVSIPTFMSNAAVKKYLDLARDKSTSLKEKKKLISNELRAFYSRGSWWGNFLEVMFPYHDLNKPKDTRPAPNTGHVVKNAIRLMFGHEKKNYNKKKQ